MGPGCGETHGCVGAGGGRGRLAPEPGGRLAVHVLRVPHEHGALAVPTRQRPAPLVHGKAHEPDVRVLHVHLLHAPPEPDQAL